MFQIGPYTLPSRVVLAPMAGVTDLPFRQLCRRFGASLAVSEMITCDSRLWNTRKSSQRLNHNGESEPRSVQIAGSDPQMMAEAARYNAEQGAQIIDINMGCPAKKVCKRAAGSALLKDEKLVEEILAAVVNAVTVPVTLKIRTGWSPQQRNGVAIAHIAEDCGVAALTVHGRTRACRFEGNAEYDTIADIKAAVSIPVIANGDIDSPEKAQQVIAHTGADAVMIGRAAQGNPWLLQQVNECLTSGHSHYRPNLTEMRQVMLDHLQALHHFYGPSMGVKIARKHTGWYLKANHHLLADDGTFRNHFNQLLSAEQQLQAIETLFQQVITGEVSTDSNRYFFTIGSALPTDEKCSIKRKKEVIAA